VPASRQLATPTDVPTTASRRHHAQMMQRAVDALKEQDPPAREFVSLTTRLDPQDIADAKKMIRSFVEDFNRRFTKPASREVYQLNLQLFRHTSED
jgi:hypothetical protein